MNLIKSVLVEFICAARLTKVISVALVLTTKVTTNKIQKKSDPNTNELVAVKNKKLAS